MIGRLSALRAVGAAEFQALRASSTLRHLQASELSVETTTAPKTHDAPENLQFGKKFADHMLLCNWTAHDGWLPPRITPHGSIAIDPSAIVFHYAIECFEGMKAYRGVDGKVRMFRPEMNMARLAHSSKRLALPAFDQEELLKCIKSLVKTDAAWVPSGRGYSLYLRPTHIGTQPALGVGAPQSSLLFVITSPCGAYYSTGFKPVRLLADPKYARAWPGGTGDTKGGCNYAPTIQPQRDAAAQGCQQVLWLFGEDHEVTEVGTMNFFMHWKNESGEDELITPPLDGTILAGVTRQSVLDLAREWGEFKVTEGKFTMAHLTRALDEDRVYELFGCGTAATVSPIGEIVYQGKEYKIPLELGEIGALGKRFSDELFDIQYGVKEHAWAPVVA